MCCDDENRITVNGHSLDESAYLYIDSDDVQINPSDVRFKVVVPADRIFVMGDHRDVSADSRCHLSDLSTNGRKGEVGFVPIENVVGPAFAIAAPFDRTSRLHRPDSFGRGAGRHRARPEPGGDRARRDQLLMSVLVRRDSGIYGYERALKRVGFDPVAGADEAGRGACAGPLVAAAVILSDTKARQIGGLNDSKLLTARQRERLYAEITAKAIAWSVVSLEPGECDVLGMHVANVMALRMALLRLETAPATC